MTAVALLIDWENLRLALVNARKAYDPAFLAKNLPRMALERAKVHDPGAFLAAQIAFAPARGFDAQTSVAITNNGMHIEMTPGVEQAADISIAIKAMKLLMGGEQVRQFVIVTNDADFIPLYNELNAGGSTCDMWLVDRSNAARAAQQLTRHEFVVELLQVGSGDDDIPPSDEQVYLLQCQRVVDQGTHLGGIDHFRHQVVELGLFDDQQAGLLWSRAVRNNLIGDLPGLRHDGQAGNSRRIAYEREAVMRTLWPAELIAFEAARDRRSRLDRAHAIDVGSVELLNAMVRAKCLVDTGSGLLPGDNLSRYGMIGVAFRVAISFYAVKAAGQTTMGMGQLITRHWPRFFKPGGNLSETEATESADDAKQAIARCVAMRLVARVDHQAPNGKKLRGFVIDEGHPLARFMRERLNRAVVELAGLGVDHKERIRVDDFVAHMASSHRPWSRFETGYWLGLLAAERVITWTAREVALNHNQLRKEIESWG